MHRLISEARVNGYAARRNPPNVPWTPQEMARDAAACRAAERGGHVAAGLGAFDLIRRGVPGNAKRVARVAEIGRAHGRDPADSAQIREILAMAA